MGFEAAKNSMLGEATEPQGGFTARTGKDRRPWTTAGLGHASTLL